MTLPPWRAGSRDHKGKGSHEELRKRLTEGAELRRADTRTLPGTTVVGTSPCVGGMLGRGWATIDLVYGTLGATWKERLPPPPSKWQVNGMTSWGTSTATQRGHWRRWTEKRIEETKTEEKNEKIKNK